MRQRVEERYRYLRLCAHMQVQLARLLKRDHGSADASKADTEATAKGLIAAQLSVAERVKRTTALNRCEGVA